MPNCHPMPSSCLAILPNVVECPGIYLAVQDFAEDLEEAPPSVSPPANSVSSNLDAAVSDSHVGKHPIGIASEPVFGSSDTGSEPGVSAFVGEGHPRGVLLGAVLRGFVGSRIQIDDVGQAPSFDEVEVSRPAKPSLTVSSAERL
ncbi:hypothetical protein Nepgr_018801 [Nepenthes gracilis]|uniref:Uncharacterized protein n=1 Tax=Nepenthes gracilis TaxID=150966 RepID=A0AAD3SU41_NEPGR|nr:hypothetical protein Nepgr_018801 [Nepenthes gracilis]